MLLPHFRTNPPGWPTQRDLTLKEWVRQDPTKGFTTVDTVADVDPEIAAKFNDLVYNRWPLEFERTGGTFLVETRMAWCEDESLDMIAAVLNFARLHCSLPVFLDAASLARRSSDRARTVSVGGGDTYPFFDFMTEEADFLMVRNFMNLPSPYSQDLLMSILSARLGKAPVTLLLRGGIDDQFEFLTTSYNRPFYRELTTEVLHG